MTGQFEAMIGLEVHVELKTRTKMFCSCSAAFGGEPNTRICPVCTGQPGALPAVNREAVLFGLVLSRELSGRIRPVSRFDRKNYFYPDNPKSYQITQHYRPLMENGWLDLPGKRIRIHELHLEEDAGKLYHTEDGRTLVDLNRAGVPLAEIVTEPDFSTADEVTAFLERLRDVAVYSGVSDGRMQEGSLRVDVNLSLRDLRTGEPGVRTEMKNLNSFTEIRHAIAHETLRQEELILSGQPVLQETRRWDEALGQSFVMRGKEEAADYRYFPEPDLYPLVVTDTLLREAEALRKEQRPEKEARFMKDFGLSAYTAGVLTEDPGTAALFERTQALTGDPKGAANVIGTEILRLLKETGTLPGESFLTPEKLSTILKMNKEGSITGAVMKELLALTYREDVDPSEYAREKGLLTVSDESLVGEWADQVIRENPGPVREYLGGKEKVLMFLLGQVMKLSKGRVKPDDAKAAIITKLKEIS
ncbi:MAG: Asp-tRNA(Asn)/Glu-tRNA(Gln) amidotransferase subunit GatB [Lachnospiraceae bacterium]|nr:Asp-tRNA(Asn)/Glu-tRNA(Gln) amidotransferase subunit GatB [Lachnospiraceae bacterium]